MLEKTIALVFLILAFGGCTRDDICPEGAAITPKLIITFNDFNVQTKRKNVVKLTVETDYEQSATILSLRETDSIAIPLDVNSGITKYRFIRTTVTENEEVTENVDNITFSYSTQDVYVNRACGFRAEFDNLEYTLSDEGDGNWIKLIKTERDNIVDEKQAHLIMYH